MVEGFLSNLVKQGIIKGFSFYPLPRRPHFLCYSPCPLQQYSKRTLTHGVNRGEQTNV